MLPCLLVPVATIASSCHHWECSVIIFKSIEDSQDKMKIEFPICLYVKTLTFHWQFCTYPMEFPISPRQAGQIQECSLWKWLHIHLYRNIFPIRCQNMIAKTGHLAQSSTE